MTNTILKQKIMKRVRTIYMLRKVINPFTLKCALLVSFLATVVSFVSTQSILANMPHILDLTAFFYFSKYAFLHTEFLVQALTLGTVGVTLWLARDIVRSLAFAPEHNMAHQ